MQALQDCDGDLSCHVTWRNSMFYVLKYCMEIWSWQIGLCGNPNKLLMSHTGLVQCQLMGSTPLPFCVKSLQHQACCSHPTRLELTMTTMTAVKVRNSSCTQQYYSFVNLSDFNSAWCLSLADHKGVTWN